MIYLLKFKNKLERCVKYLKMLLARLSAETLVQIRKMYKISINVSEETLHPSISDLAAKMVTIMNNESIIYRKNYKPNLSKTT